MSFSLKPLTLSLALAALVMGCVSTAPSPALDASASTTMFSFTREALHRGVKRGTSVAVEPSLQTHKYQVACLNGTGSTTAAARFKKATAIINRTQPQVYESFMGDSHQSRDMIRNANAQIVTQVGCQVVGLDRRVITHDTTQLFKWAHKRNVLLQAMGVN